MNIISIAFILTATLSCPTEDFCRRCDFKTSKCLWCEDSILSTNGACDPNQKPIENCEKNNAADPKLCELCKYGFGVAADSKSCAQCKDTKCARCNIDAEKCDACYTDTALQNGECVKSTISVVENCAINHSSEDVKIPICLVCNEGFALNGDKCVKPPCDNCIEFSDKVCDVCKKGFYVHEDGDCMLNKTRKPKDKKGSFWWVFFLLLIIAGGAAAYWYVKIRPNSNRTESLI